MRRVTYRRCDVFTERALNGNALAVFRGVEGLDSSVLQALAREMNLSECSFLLPPSSPDADARIRIFTPTMELPFAGHPTLGSAFVLSEGASGPSVLRLETGRGVSTVSIAADANGARFGDRDRARRRAPAPVFPARARAGCSPERRARRGGRARAGHWRRSDRARLDTMRPNAPDAA